MIWLSCLKPNPNQRLLRASQVRLYRYFALVHPVSDRHQHFITDCLLRIGLNLTLISLHQTFSLNCIIHLLHCTFYVVSLLHFKTMYKLYLGCCFSCSLWLSKDTWFIVHDWAEISHTNSCRKENKWKLLSRASLYQNTLLFSANVFILVWTVWQLLWCFTKKKMFLRAESMIIWLI